MRRACIALAIRFWSAVHGTGERAVALCVVRRGASTSQGDRRLRRSPEFTPASGFDLRFRLPDAQAPLQ
jgi:hypothetical protein